ncbi:UNVERIFIED_CONTAM: hypothetical protein FKN15_027478 [Acipenser sinensis]
MPTCPAVPNKQCQVTEVILKKAYAASAFSAQLSNYNSVLVAYQAHLVRSFTNLGPSIQQLDELCLLSRALLRLSKLSEQTVGRNLAALVAARRQMWLSQAHMSDGDKTVLLDASVTPGRTFGPAVDDMLQRELVHLFLKCPPPVCKQGQQHWQSWHQWCPRFQAP